MAFQQVQIPFLSSSIPDIWCNFHNVSLNAQRFIIYIIREKWTMNIRQCEHVMYFYCLIKTSWILLIFKSDLQRKNNWIFEGQIGNYFCTYFEKTLVGDKYNLHLVLSVQSLNLQTAWIRVTSFCLDTRIQNIAIKTEIITSDKLCIKRNNRMSLFYK